MAKTKQYGYVISSPRGISNGLREQKVYLSIDEYGRIGEYTIPVVRTFIHNRYELRRKLAIARRWYQNIDVFKIHVELNSFEKEK